MNGSIKSVSERTGLSAYTIRYYEKMGIIPEVKRDENGVRVFTEQDVAWLELVKCFKWTHMKVENIKEIVSLSQLGDSTIEERKALLLEHRETILNDIKQLEESLAKIDKKIAYYNGEKEC